MYCSADSGSERLDDQRAVRERVLVQLREERQIEQHVEPLARAAAGAVEPPAHLQRSIQSSTFSLYIYTIQYAI